MKNCYTWVWVPAALIMAAATVVAAHSPLASHHRLLTPDHNQADGHDEHHDHNHHHHNDEFCGFQEPTREEELVQAARIEGSRRRARQQGRYGRRTQQQQQGFDGETLCRQCITIDMYFHLITAQDVGFGPFIPHPQDAVDRLNNGDPTLVHQDFSNRAEMIDMIVDNVAVLNTAFADTPFQFNFTADHVTETANTEWTLYAHEFANHMSRDVGQGDVRKMDVFVNYRLLRRNSNDGEVTGTRRLGFATLPFAQLEGRGDGVYLRYDVLTGGGYENWNFGYAFVHEVGHWLGLYHTFQSSLPDDETCNPDDTNDFVEDTPIQAGPTASIVADCTEYLADDVVPLDSCDNLEGNDAIFNYLNYLDNDYCWEVKGEFTPMQIERMYRHWSIYRDHKPECEDPDDMEIEIVITFDEDHAKDNHIILEDADQNTIFDSNVDHRGSFAFVLQETLFMDVCVPNTSTYRLKVFDSAGDGFTNGHIRVYRNKILLDTVEGVGFASRQVVIPPVDTFVLGKDPEYLEVRPVVQQMGGRLRGTFGDEPLP